jgi:hypothetical protein
MLFSGLPRSALLRLLQATEPGATFDVEVPAGKGIGGVTELRITSGCVHSAACVATSRESERADELPRPPLVSRIPLRVKAMKAWLAELSEDSDEEPEDTKSIRASPQAGSARSVVLCSSTSPVWSTGPTPALAEGQADAGGASKQSPAASPAQERLPPNAWGTSIDPFLSGPSATQALSREPSAASSSAARPPPALPHEAQPMDIDDSLAPMLASTAASGAVPATERSSAVTSHPVPAFQPNGALYAKPSLGQASATEDVKPSLRELASSAVTKAPRLPQAHENAVAGPSSTSRRQSTVSVARSATSAARASPVVEETPAAPSARTIPRLSPVPPSTPPGQDDFAPEWSSHKPPDGTIKRKADGSPSTSQPAAAKYSRLEPGPNEGETDDDEGESEVASDVDELENQDEEEVRVEVLLPDKPNLEGKGRAVDAIIAAEAEVHVGSVASRTLEVSSGG